MTLAPAIIYHLSPFATYTIRQGNKIAFLAATPFVAPHPAALPRPSPAAAVAALVFLSMFACRARAAGPIDR